MFQRKKEDVEYKYMGKNMNTMFGFQARKI
jgi:hypothetical protein